MATMSNGKTGGEKRRRNRTGWIPVTTGLLFMLGAGLLIGRWTKPFSPWQVYLWAFASLFYGGLVGLSEILSRYRDEPVLASTTGAGLVYLLLNGLISLAAFAVLCKYRSALFPNLGNDLFLTSMVAGFGGMTVFRSKLFTFRSSEGKDYAIGPALVLETVLSTIDQKIDRRRATERQAMIFDEMRDLTDFDHTAQYFEASLNSFQNLTEEDKAKIISVIREYRTSPFPERLKIMAMGFAFLNIAGEENFDEVIKNIRQFLESLRTQVPSPTPSNVSPPGSLPPQGPQSP
jgi:hypothetical protein